MTTGAVKRLISLYDSPATPSEANDPTRPTPSPARFLHHNTSRPSYNTNDETETLLASDENTFLAHSTAVDTADVTDELKPGGNLHFRESSGGARVKKWLHGENKDAGPSRRSEEYHLLSDMSPVADEFNPQSTSLTGHAESLTSSVTVAPRPQLPAHTPIPVSRVFSRVAPPLSLPRLDKYISTIRPPSFATTAAGKGKNVAMFEPMDRLVASGKSLVDLETSSRQYPSWENRNSIMGTITGIVLGVTGSSALATLYSFQGLLNTLQIFALIVNTIVPRGGEDVSGEWKALLSGTIPNILAFNFTTNLLNSTIYLAVVSVMAAVLMFLFIRWTAPCTHYRNYEGFMHDKQSSGWGIHIVTFLLTAMYLPVSTLAVHMIVWSDDLWVVANPYTNATTNPPIVSPLGPTDEYRDPLDFCWTSTMKLNEFNYAPLVITVSIVVFFGYTVLYPITLRSAIKQAVPVVDPYTELGKRRNASEIELEYYRLLDRDRNPLNFLYHNFRHGWGVYESVYLFIKLSALLIVTIINPSNCLFRTLPSTTISVIRQSILILFMTAFFIAHCWFTPFLEPVNNASEWFSRVNYVLTSVISLLVVLSVPGESILDGPVLYILYATTYGFSIYFTVINWGMTQREVKRLFRRIDFSIDIFSPRLDISGSSPHVRRRIWQESITTLFLTDPECKIPVTQPMQYSLARDVEYAPYLLDFAGSPGERHVENLKILRDVGSAAYSKAIGLVSGAEQDKLHHLVHEIQTRFIGPDCYWKNPISPSIPGCTRFFGNAWWIPFPPTLVIRYDDGPLVALKELHEIHEYVRQNSSPYISRKREIRMALRSLDGHTVYWPHRHIETSGSRGCCSCSGMRFKAQTSVDFQVGVFTLKRRGYLLWKNQQLGSGFDVTIKYSKSVKCDGTVIGLNEDFDLTPQLAQFLAMNHRSITTLLPAVESTMHDYRHALLQESRRKLHALTYCFLTHVYNQPPSPTDVTKSVIHEERDHRVRRLVAENAAVLDTTFERLTAVTTSEVATWWYLFWDDFWRRNQWTISALKVHNTDFDPHYPSSIAYTPLPRPALESFLAQRGMFHATPQWGDFVHNGFLNKVYVRLNDIVFHDSHQANIFHLGYNTSELDMEDIDLETQIRPSGLGTGGGTDHDDSSIRPRPAYRWEGILGDPIQKGPKAHRRWLAKFGAWFGLTPTWRQGIPSLGLSLDVELDGGQYVVMGATPGSGLTGAIDMDVKGKGKMLDSGLAS